MNKQRRKAIEALRARFDRISYADMKQELDAIKDELDTLKSEEEEYRDNMPDNMRDGEKGEIAGNAIDAMDSIVNAIDAVVEALDGLDNEVNFDGAMGEG